MFEFLRSKTFDTAFSLVLGIGLMALFKPGCKDGECSIQKAPPYDEVSKSTYQLGSKCYKFKPASVECPDAGVIEPFVF